MASVIRPISEPPRSGARVIPFPADTDRAIVSAIRAGSTAAKAQLFDRYGHAVERILWRTLGPDDEIEDLLHDVFLAAFSSLGKLRDDDAVGGWLVGIAIRQARKRLRKRSRGRFIQLFAPETLPPKASSAASPEVQRALKVCYEILDRLPVELRIAFALRYIDGMELTEVADACGVSLATTKRHVSRAEERFRVHAAKSSALVDWFGGEP